MTVRVLIVDDHPSFRASARRLLESEGYEVVGEAATGAGAIAATKKLRPDVVLLDVQLPDLDGFEVARRIGEKKGAPHVILTSSRDRCDYGSSIANSSVRGFAPKAELSG